MHTNQSKQFCLPTSCRIALHATLGALLAGACGGNESPGSGNGSTDRGGAGTESGSAGSGSDSAGSGGGGNGGDGCGVDCPDASGPAPSSECESFRDQIPPPDVREISITNTGTVPLYIRVSPQCPKPYLLFEVQRDGQTLEEPKTCDDDCPSVMDQGWRFGPATMEGPGCTHDCGAPAPVSIEPGQTRREAVKLEAVARQLPRGCAQGISSDSIQCFSRVIPQPGNYQVIVRATRELKCVGTDCDCRPNSDGTCSNFNVESPDSNLLVFTFSTPSLFQGQTFELSAP